MDDSGFSSCCDTGISSTGDTGFSSTCGAGFSSTFDTGFSNSCDTGFSSSNNCDSGTMGGGLNDTAFSYGNFTGNTHAHASHHDSYMHATSALFPATNGYMDAYYAPSARAHPYYVSDRVVRCPGDSSVYIGRPMVILTPQQRKDMQRTSKRSKCIMFWVSVLALAAVITIIALALNW